MSNQTPEKLLFVVNPHSGNKVNDWQTLIRNHYKDEAIAVELIMLDEQCRTEPIYEIIERFKPDRVIAVGGDGTVKLLTECILHKNLPMAIIPGGSANGLAKELGIPADITKALNLVTTGKVESIHLIKINDELCIHLADIGFNAFVIKKFETESGRGMWGYIKASWKVLWKQPKMMIELAVNGIQIKRNAAMVVIANATRYGSGAVINPDGDMQDKLFEVIIIKKISFTEIYKMMVTHMAYDPEKTEVYHTESISIRSKRKAHFQVDGEYLGKVTTISGTILPAAVKVVVPLTGIGVQ